MGGRKQAERLTTLVRSVCVRLLFDLRGSHISSGGAYSFYSQCGPQANEIAYLCIVGSDTAKETGTIVRSV